MLKTTSPLSVHSLLSVGSIDRTVGVQPYRWPLDIDKAMDFAPASCNGMEGRYCVRPAAPARGPGEAESRRGGFSMTEVGEEGGLCRALGRK